MGVVPPRPRAPRVRLVYLCRYCRAESATDFERCDRCGAPSRGKPGEVLGGFRRATIVYRDESGAQ